MRVVDVTTNEPPVNASGDKQIRYDINCILDDGDKANVEMTLRPTTFEAYKMEYYLARLHTTQEAKGKETGYQNLKQSYQISIFAKANMFKDSHFFHRFVYSDPEHGVDLGGRTALYTVELKKLGEVIKKAVLEMTAMEMWAFFFAYYTDPSKQGILQQIMEHDKEIRMAQKMLSRITPEEEAALYQMSVDKAIMDRATREYEHKQRLKRIKLRTLRQGRKEGIEQGLEHGRSEGASAVVDLLRKGWTLEQIETYLKETSPQ